MESCKNGHPYTEETLVWAKPKGNGKPYKKCRICAREAWHRHKKSAPVRGDLDNGVLIGAVDYFYRVAGFFDSARYAPNQEARIERIADARKALKIALEVLGE